VTASNRNPPTHSRIRAVAILGRPGGQPPSVETGGSLKSKADLVATLGRPESDRQAEWVEIAATAIQLRSSAARSKAATRIVGILGLICGLVAILGRPGGRSAAWYPEYVIPTDPLRSPVAPEGDRGSDSVE
jgi:hypothetical protein